MSITKTINGININANSTFSVNDITDLNDYPYIPARATNTLYAIEAAPGTIINFSGDVFTHVLKSTGQIKVLNVIEGTSSAVVEGTNIPSYIIPFTLENVGNINAFKLDIQTNVDRQLLTVESKNATQTNSQTLYVSLVAGETFIPEPQDTTYTITIDTMKFSNFYGLNIDSQIEKVKSGLWKIQYVIKETDTHYLRNENEKDLILTIHLNENSIKVEETELVISIEDEQLEEALEDNNEISITNLDITDDIVDKAYLIINTLNDFEDTLNNGAGVEPIIDNNYSITINIVSKTLPGIFSDTLNTLKDTLSQPATQTVISDIKYNDVVNSTNKLTYLTSLIDVTVPGEHLFTVVANDGHSTFTKEYMFKVKFNDEDDAYIEYLIEPKENESNEGTYSYNYILNSDYNNKILSNIIGINSVHLHDVLNDLIRFNYNAMNGYDMNGYDMNGYDMNGYDINGYDISGSRLTLSELSDIINELDLDDTINIQVDYGSSLQKNLQILGIRNDLVNFTLRVIGSPTTLQINYLNNSNATITKTEDFVLNLPAKLNTTDPNKIFEDIEFITTFEDEQRIIKDISFHVRSKKTGYSFTNDNFGAQTNYSISTDNKLSLTRVGESEYDVVVNVTDNYEYNYSMHFSVNFRNDTPVVFSADTDDYYFDISFNEDTGIYEWPSGDNGIILKLVNDVSLRYLDALEQLTFKPDQISDQNNETIVSEFFKENVVVSFKFEGTINGNTIEEYFVNNIPIKDTYTISQDQNIRNGIAQRNNIDLNTDIGKTLYNQLFESVTVGNGILRFEFRVFNSNGLYNELFKIDIDKDKVKINTTEPTITIPDNTFDVSFNRNYLNTRDTLYPAPINWYDLLVKDVNLNVLSASTIELSVLDPSFNNNKATYTTTIGNFVIVIEITAKYGNTTINTNSNGTGFVNSFELFVGDKSSLPTSLKNGLKNITLHFVITQTNTEIINNITVNHSKTYTLTSEPIPLPTISVDSLPNNFNIEYYQCPGDVSLSGTQATYSITHAFNTSKNSISRYVNRDGFTVIYSGDYEDNIGQTTSTSGNVSIIQGTEPAPSFSIPNIPNINLRYDVSYNATDYMTTIFGTTDLSVTSWDTAGVHASSRIITIDDISNVEYTYFAIDNDGVKTESTSSLSDNDTSYNELIEGIPDIEERARTIKLKINLSVTNDQTRCGRPNESPKTTTETLEVTVTHTHDSTFTLDLRNELQDLLPTDELPNVGINDNLNTNQRILISPMNYNEETLTARIANFWNNRVISPYFGTTQTHTWSIRSILSAPNFFSGDLVVNESDLIEIDGSGNGLDELKQLFGELLKNKYPIEYRFVINTTDEYNNNDVTEAELLRIRDDINVNRLIHDNLRDNTFVLNVNNFNKNIGSISGLFSYNINFTYNSWSITYDNYYKIDAEDRIEEFMSDNSGNLNTRDSKDYPVNGVDASNNMEYQANTRSLVIPNDNSVIDISVPGKHRIEITPIRENENVLQATYLISPGSEGLWKNITLPEPIVLILYVIDINPPKVMLNGDLGIQTYVVKPTDLDEFLSDFDNENNKPLAQAVDHYGNDINNIVALENTESLIIINTIIREKINVTGLYGEYNILKRSNIGAISDQNLNVNNIIEEEILVAGNLDTLELKLGDNERIIVEYITLTFEGIKTKFSEPKYIIYDNDNNANNDSGAIGANVNEIIANENNLVLQDENGNDLDEGLVDVINPQSQPQPQPQQIIPRSRFGLLFTR